MRFLGPRNITCTRAETLRKRGQQDRAMKWPTSADRSAQRVRIKAETKEDSVPDSINLDTSGGRTGCGWPWASWPRLRLLRAEIDRIAMGKESRDEHVQKKITIEIKRPNEAEMEKEIREVPRDTKRGAAYRD